MRETAITQRFSVIQVDNRAGSIKVVADDKGAGPPRVVLRPIIEGDGIADCIIQRADVGVVGGGGGVLVVNVPAPESATITSGSGTVVYGGGQNVVVTGTGNIVAGHNIVTNRFGNFTGTFVTGGDANFTSSGAVSTTSGVLVEIHGAPERVDVRAGSTFGDIDLGGVVNAAHIRTESGNTKIGIAGTVDVNTTSGDITAHQLTGPSTVQSTSGTISLACDAPVTAASISGDVTVTLNSGGDVKSTSGNVTAYVTARSGDTQVSASTVSGNVRVHREPGANPNAIRARSVTGSVRVD